MLKLLAAKRNNIFISNSNTNKYLLSVSEIEKKTFTLSITRNNIKIEYIRISLTPFSQKPVNLNMSSWHKNKFDSQTMKKGDILQ